MDVAGGGLEDNCCHTHTIITDSEQFLTNYLCHQATNCKNTIQISSHVQVPTTNSQHTLRTKGLLMTRNLHAITRHGLVEDVISTSIIKNITVMHISY